MRYIEKILSVVDKKTSLIKDHLPKKTYIEKLETAISLLLAYDAYIQEANDLDKYNEGWRPVCIDEFYQNEFQEEEKGETI